LPIFGKLTHLPIFTKNSKNHLMFTNSYSSAILSNFLPRFWQNKTIRHLAINNTNQNSNLFEQEISVVRRTGDKVLGQLEEGLEQLQSQVFSRRLAQKVGNH
jgi:hypothetical protein